MRNLPRKKFISESDQFCENLYAKTTTRNKNGKYIVSLSFKETFPKAITLGNSRSSALFGKKIVLRRIRLSIPNTIRFRKNISTWAICLKSLRLLISPLLNNSFFHIIWSVRPKGLLLRSVLYLMSHRLHQMELV